MQTFKKIVLWLLALTFKVVIGKPCPVETPLYGGATLDGSPDEFMQYFAVTDEDLTRIT